MTRSDDSPPRSRPSRAQKKRVVEPYEVLAHELAEMTVNQYAQVDLPDILRDEVDLARRTKGPNSRKRQAKFLAGFLHRHADETQQVIASVQRLHLSHHSDQILFHSVEALRDRLCEPDRMESALREVQEKWPQLDLPTLQRLAEQVQIYADRRARRELFKRLRDAAESSPPEAPDR